MNKKRSFLIPAAISLSLVFVFFYQGFSAHRNLSLIAPLYSLEAKIKFGLTNLLGRFGEWYRPESTHISKMNLADETHIQTHQSHPDLSILQEHIGEDLVALARTADYESLIKLASAVSKMLPKESVKPRTPEPYSALELLGVEDGVPYPKLCSKDAKIYVQILNSVGLNARVIEVQNHVLSEVFLPTEQAWAAIDPYWGCGISKNGSPISAAEANKLLLESVESNPFDYCWEHDRFKTLVVNPVNRLIEGRLPRWNYWNYDNLDYYKVKAVWTQSPQLWVDRMKSQN